MKEDFKSEPLLIRDGHSQNVQAAKNKSGSGAKDSVNFPSLTTALRVIIDEGIFESSAIFKSFLLWLGNVTGNFLFLSKAHPGIPDIEIINKLLPKYGNILTTDRVLHNRVFDLNCGGNIKTRYNPRNLKSKIGSKEPENRQNLSFATASTN